MKKGKTVKTKRKAQDENKRNTGKHRETDFPKMRSRLELLRKDFGYTQNQVAEYIDCSHRAYRSWIVGKYKSELNETLYVAPTLEYLQKLSALYKVSIDYITGNSEYTRIGNQEMSQKTGLTNDAIEALHLLHAPMDPSCSNTLQEDRYDIIALNIILEDFYNNMKNAEDFDKYSKSTDTPLNQIGRYLDSGSISSDAKIPLMPIMRQNKCVKSYDFDEIIGQIAVSELLELLRQLKKKYLLSIMFLRKENLKYFNDCFENYAKNDSTDTH